jgi:hypothetical protein
MVVIQYLTGMRPSEVFNMRVGDIDRSRRNGLWYYVPGSHKTEEHIGKKPIPLGKPEQDLIAPCRHRRSFSCRIHRGIHVPGSRYAQKHRRK